MRAASAAGWLGGGTAVAEPILVLDGLRKSYGALTVTDGLSMAVEEGAIHALIGPNGAGKTTLIGQVCGQIANDDGHIRFAGGDDTGRTMPVGRASWWERGGQNVEKQEVG